MCSIVTLDWNLPFELMCDASNYVVGAILGQSRVKDSHVIYYACNTLNDTQLNYVMIEKELLAIVFTCGKFRPYLIKNKVVIYTDHYALKHLMAKKDEKPRLETIYGLLLKT